MKILTLILLIILNISCCCAQQNELSNKVDNLKYVKEMPYIPELSGDSLFWVVIKEKIAIVPFLIKRLDDTTRTEAFVPNFGANYTVADIAYEAVKEIIHGLPTLNFTEDPDNPEPKDGYWGYWNYIRRSFENREKFKSRVNAWYIANKDNLEWIEDTSSYRSASDWKFEANKHPAKGYYRVKE
jgi:hypothetical protein